MGYEWYPVVDYRPVNGLPSVVDLRAAMSDVGGPVYHRVGYDQDDLKKRDASRNLRYLNYGVRPMVEMGFDVLDATADQAVLAELVTRAADRDRWRVDLSLDGGVTSRRVSLRDYRGPTAISGKTIVGARHVVHLDVEDLLQGLPAMIQPTPGPSAWLLNGGFEEWSSASDALGWTEMATGNYTIAREGSVVRSGSFACRISCTGVGGSAIVTSSPFLGLRPGRFYQLTVYGRSDVTLAAQALRARVVNITDGLTVASDGKTWSAGVNSLLVTPTVGAWATGTAIVQVRTDFGEDDSYRIELEDADTTNPSNLYIDDVALVGPVSPTGVVRW